VARNIIDELIAVLKLDDKQFKQAMSEARREFRATEEQSKKSGESMGSDIASLAKKYLGLLAILALLKKGLSSINDTAEATMNLANQSRHLGQSASWIRNYQNAVQMLGGTAEDANASVETFMKSLFDLTTMGKVGGNLEMLARLGVQFQDSRGGARDYGDVAVDAGAAVRRQIAQGTLDKSTGYYALREAGFDDATARGGVEGTLNAELMRAARLRQVSGSDVAQQTELARANILRKQQQQAMAVGVVSSPVGDAVDALMDGLNKMLEWLMSPDRWWNNDAPTPMASAGAARSANPGAYPGSGQIPDNWLTRLGTPVVPTPMAAGGSTVNHTTIGSVTVNTRATDARGVAKDLRTELRKQNVATADGGQN
jgi:hypothetical protein